MSTTGSSTNGSSSTSASSSVFLPPAQTRLVTIIAHVDHGKTTLADNLIEHNGIISERLAGTLRYLDSDPEEQRRGITMRSSAIGLQHKYDDLAPKKKQKMAAADAEESSSSATVNPKKHHYIVHLLDSPGHTDFSMEVSSALVACDSGLLVLDAVEGMAPRTHQVLREAHLHRLVPILVINKIDRLYTDLALTATEAYMRLRAVLETVNAAASAMLQSAAQQQQQQQAMAADAANVVNDAVRQQQERTDVSNSNDDNDEMERLWTFDPAAGNVIFASALYGWGFTVQSLARALFRQKILPLKPVALKQCLFSDAKYVNGKVMKWKASSSQDAAGAGEQPLFAEYALQPLWTMYEAIATASQINPKVTAQSTGMDVVLRTLQQTASATSTSTVIPTSMDDLEQVLKRTGASSQEAVLRALLRRYRPLATVVMDVICEYSPSPAQAVETVRAQVLSLQEPPPASLLPTSAGTAEAPSATNSDIEETTKFQQELDQIQRAIQTCDASPSVPVLAHVCKFMSTDRLHIRDSDLPSTVSDSNLMLGLARVLSGVLRTGDLYYLYGPKYQPKKTSGDETPMHQRTVRLYLLMGSSFVSVPAVPAGHLCGIFFCNATGNQLQGDQQQQPQVQEGVLPFKTVTICSSPYGMPLRGFADAHHIRPLVKVSVEAENSADTAALERGLVKLSLADAAVEVTTTARGERILACLGELHLEQSILELEKVYCGKNDIQLRISDPIVDFGETTVWFDNETDDFDSFYNNSKSVPPLRQMTIPPYNDEEGLWYAARGRSRAVLSGRGAAIRLRAVPLAPSIYKAIKTGAMVPESDMDDLRKLGRGLGLCHSSTSGSDANSNGEYEVGDLLKQIQGLICSVDSSGNALMESPGLRNGTCVKGVQSEKGEIYVPKKNRRNEEAVDMNDNVDNNMPVSESPEFLVYEALQACIRESAPDSTKDIYVSAIDSAAQRIWMEDIKGSAVAGFQMALRAGWICEEPVRNVMVVLEGVEIALAPSSEIASRAVSGGMVMSALRTGIRSALLSRPARLMEVQLRLTLHASLAALGALYSVLSKRRGKVLEDSMVDGTDLLLITALIPQAESFGLAPELLRKTSGEVTAPELIFDHWELLDVDPFWIPTSLEEREDYGELRQAGDASTGIDNTALHYIRRVRERKGLMVDSSRTVVAAEKQRTLKR